MSYPKQKAERYSNFGGINTKVSRYQTNQQQVIRLINYDFSTPGALTKRPGFQYFTGASFGGFITQLYTYQRLSGASYQIVQGQTGLFFTGNTTSILYPLLYPGASGAIGVSINAAGSVGQTHIPLFKTLNDTLYIASNPNYTKYEPGDEIILQPNQVYPYTPATGATIGARVPYARPVMPEVLRPLGATYASYGAGAFFTSQLSYRWYVAAQTGSSSRLIYGGTPFLQAYYQLNNVISAPTWYGLVNQSATYVSLSNFNSIVNGAMDQGASFLLMFRQILSYTANVLNIDLVPLTTTVFQIPVLSNAFTAFIDYGTYNTTGTTGAASFCLGFTAAQQFQQHSYLPFNPTWNNNNTSTNRWLENSSPTIIEVFNNMLLIGGFPTAKSKLYWSNLAIPFAGGVGGGPEYIEPENYAEIRTNDGDELSNITAFGTECVIGKRLSIHSFTGTSPDSVSITLKTDQYGVLSKRGACTWGNVFWFLDRKGIVEYNGANFQIVSTEVEDIFKRMNYDWAQSIAIMSHQKMRNEIWCCIPVDGATYNNIVVVYDYVSKAWTTYEGVNASALIATALTMPFPQPTIGASGGRVAQMGVSNFSDFGGVYTTGVRFPFVTNYGWSVQQVFRRLFIDTDPVIGQNRSFTINLYGDMLNNASYSTVSTFGATFQYRTDFGMYCKSMSVEVFEATTFALKLNGYTVESRFQRNV